MKKTIRILLTLIMVIPFLPALHIKAEETSNFVTYEEAFTSADEVKTYQINFDFTDIESFKNIFIIINIYIYLSDYYIGKTCI